MPGERAPHLGESFMPLESSSRTAAELGVHVNTVRALHKSGRIPGYFVGRVLKFDIEECRAALRSTPIPPPKSRRVRNAPNLDALDTPPPRTRAPKTNGAAKATITKRKR